MSKILRKYVRKKRIAGNKIRWKKKQNRLSLKYKQSKSTIFCACPELLQSTTVEYMYLHIYLQDKRK